MQNINYTVVAIVVVVLVVLGGIFLASRGPDADEAALNSEDGTETTVEGSTSGTVSTGGSITSSGSSTVTTNGATTANSGRVIFMVTDEAAKLNDVSSINMTVNKLEVRNKNTGAWAVVSTTPKTYSLLDLHAASQSKVLADARVRAGIYDQMRLNIDLVQVKTKAGAIKTAKLPSKVLTILDTNLIVTLNTVSSARFDFLADDSLHITTIGDYIFAPVVVTKTQSGVENLSISESGVVLIGKAREDKVGSVGMDIDGTVKANFKIDPELLLGVDVNGRIRVEEPQKPKNIVQPVDD